MAKKVELLALKAVQVPVEKLAPNPWNPNRQTEREWELLLKSIRDDGFTQPILALATVGADGKHQIIDGEHRWRAAKELGYRQVPVVLVDLDETRAKVATIRHNTARGHHSLEQEIEILRDLAQLGALDWATSALGLSKVEVERLLADLRAADALAGDSPSEAWVPAPREGAAAAEIARHADVVSRSSAVATTAESRAIAAEVVRRAEANPEVAPDILASLPTYSIRFSFTGAEAELVRRALGTRPGEAVVQMCKRALEENLFGGGYEH